jgi:carbon storage regulator
MLVLTRKPGEQVTIDGGITVTVVSVRAGRVRVAIEAPPQVRILRAELIAKAERGQWDSNDRVRGRLPQRGQQP